MDEQPFANIKLFQYTFKLLLCLDLKPTYVVSCKARTFILRYVCDKTDMLIQQYF